MEEKMNNKMTKANSYRKVFPAFLISVLCTGFWGIGLAHAKAEQMPIRSSQERAEQSLAKQNLKAVDVRKIQDPEARKAIQEIMRYLRVQKNGKSGGTR